jgi:hypothetical protein
MNTYRSNVPETDFQDSQYAGLFGRQAHAGDIQHVLDPDRGTFRT